MKKLSFLFFSLLAVTLLTACNDDEETVTIIVNDVFAEQYFTPQVVEDIYQKVKEILPSTYEGYFLTIKTHGYEIKELIPNRLMKHKDKDKKKMEPH